MKVESGSRPAQNLSTMSPAEPAPQVGRADTARAPDGSGAPSEKGGPALPADVYASGAGSPPQAGRKTLTRKSSRAAFLGEAKAAEAARPDPNQGIPDGRIDTLRPADPSKAAQLDPFTANSKVYHVNGVGSDVGERTRDAQRLSDLLGKEVQQVHNNTDGQFQDVLESGLQLGLGVSNPPTGSLAGALHQDLGKLLRGETDQNVTLSAHSQGGIIATAALSEAIGQLRKDGWNDQQIRDTVSRHVQVNLMGSPVNPSFTDPAKAQPLSLVPPGLDPGPQSKPLSYFFGGDQNVRDFLTDGKSPPDIPNGAGFNTVRNPKDLVATTLYNLGRDDLKALVRNPFAYLGGQLKDLAQNPKDPGAHSLGGDTGYYHTTLSAYLA